MPIAVLAQGEQEALICQTVLNQSIPDVQFGKLKIAKNDP